MAEALVRILVAGLAVDDENPEAAITAGLRFGGEAFNRGASLHHTGKALDLLVAMTIAAAEKAAAGNDMPRGSISAGLWLARRLQDRASLLSLAAIRGYTQAHGEALRDRFRHLRHDLRNPLGTIKSVLALLDDESVPLEARASPEFRAIAKRNARSLEEMITDRLSDTAVPLSPIGAREVSLRAVVSAVRRDLSDEAARRKVTVLVDSAELRGRFDAAGLDLLLRATLQAALQESPRGEQLRIEFDLANKDRALVSLSASSGHVPIRKPGVVEHLAILARTIGASATVSDRVLIVVPIQPSDREPRISVQRSMVRESIASDVAETPQSDVAESLHDLRSTREGDHGQASAL